jgi:hypothetical protein
VTQNRKKILQNDKNRQSTKTNKQTNALQAARGLTRRRLLAIRWQCDDDKTDMIWYVPRRLEAIDSTCISSVQPLTWGSKEARAFRWGKNYTIFTLVFHSITTAGNKVIYGLLDSKNVNFIKRPKHSVKLSDFTV